MSARASFGILLALTLASPCALAQQPALTPKAAAQESYGKGLKLANQADAKGDPSLFEAAYLQFAQAYAIYPDDKVLWNLAASEFHTKRFVDAIRHFRAYDEHQHVAAQASHPDHARFLRLIAEAEAATGRITVEAPRGSEVQLDGKVVGVAPLPGPLDVMPGDHTVEARSGAQRKTLQVSVLAGQAMPVALVLDTTALVATPVVTGGIEPSPVGTVAHPESSAPYWTERRTVGVVIAGVGVAGMVVGGVFGVLRGGETSDASKARAQVGTGSSACDSPTAARTAPCASERSALQSNSTDAHLEEGFLIGGGVLLAAGLVTTFWPTTSKVTTVGTSPTFGPQMAGVQWAGRF